MPELEGVWDVRRTGGLMPPLLGVRKRIHGTRGTTQIAGGVGASFDVVGLELHYRGPFSGFVDILTRHDDGFRGRATFRGREFGQFEMARVQGGAVAAITEQLIKHLDEAHAMEQAVLRMLDTMIGTVDDPELVRELDRHKSETEEHTRRLRERLEAHGAAPSVVKQAGGIIGALAKMPLELLRGEKTGRSARDGYVAEHMEIASYELLERVARAAGDDETEALCREIIAQERAMADAIAARWDAIAELSLREEGVAAA